MRPMRGAPNPEISDRIVDSDPPDTPTHHDLAVGGEDLADKLVRLPVGQLALATAVAHGVARVARAQPHAAAVRRTAGPAPLAEARNARLLAVNCSPHRIEEPILATLHGTAQFGSGRSWAATTERTRSAIGGEFALGSEPRRESLTGIDARGKRGDVWRYNNHGRRDQCEGWKIMPGTYLPSAY